MKAIIFIFLIVLAGCRTVRLQEVPVKTETKVVERLVPVTLPADSAVLTALLECDSTNKVRIREIAELKGSRVESSFTLEDNQLNYKVKTKPDTVYLPTKDSIVEREVPFMVEVPYEVNRLTAWQSFRLWLGNALLFLGAGWGVFQIFKSFLKRN